MNQFNHKQIYEEFESLSQEELKGALSVIPSDPIHRFLVFFEAIRVLDNWSVVTPTTEEPQTAIDFQILQWGWNLAARHLFSSLKGFAGIHLADSTNQSRAFAQNLLHKFGRSVLMTRAAEMIKHGYLIVERFEKGFSVRSANKMSSQFLDELEFFRLESLEDKLNNPEIKSFGDWELADINDQAFPFNRVGNFFGRESGNPLSAWKRDDIDDLMKPLIHPWDSGHGIMMGYEAIPEVDFHFLSEAIRLIVKWREEAGIHPTVQLEEISGSDLAMIVTIMVSSYIKHAKFASLAAKEKPEISIWQSLTIWEPLKELEQNIAESEFLKLSASGEFDQLLVRKALSAITMRADEVSAFNEHAPFFMPLLLDLGNGLVLCPISSLIRNPFFSIAILQELRYPESKMWISEPREKWMRTELYGLFQGWRYQCLEGNIKIRDDNTIITDIDAAIFDRLTGELALFQLKWQDYSTNNIRQLRSKASNLTNDLDEWADKVTTWINRNGLERLANCFHLKLRKNESITCYYLFGLSHAAARMQGYGFETESESLAIANWPLFVRTRYEIGPTEQVFHELHLTLRRRMNESTTVQPLSITVQVSGFSVKFDGLWNAYEGK
jgi:hypothetical protein